MNTRHWIAAAALLLIPTSLFSQTLTLKQKGKQINTLSIKALKKQVSAKEIRVYEPHEEKEITYIGFDTHSVLAQVFGNKWKEEEEILFTCRDGYQPSIPVDRFLKYKSYLVFKRKGSKKFEVLHKTKNNKLIDLGPFYLIWDNVRDPILKSDGASGWPYQVTTLDLIRFQDQFPKIAPLEKSSTHVKEGFLSFRKYCLTCHTINGQGGKVAAELNYPVNVTEYFKTTWLRRWIDNPKSMRFNTIMPPLNPRITGRDRNRVINNIIAYLRAMKSAKRKP